MSDSTNSMLLNPNLPQGAPTGAVPKLVSHTEPFPVKEQEETKYYYCTLAHHSMFRSDGKKLAFVFNICATKDVYDIAYLEADIAANNPFVRHADKTQIHHYQMRMDPKGTVAKEITPQIESQLRVELETKIRNEMLARMSQAGVVMNDEQKAKVAGEEVMDTEPAIQQVDARTRIAALRGENGEKVQPVGQGFQGSIQGSGDVKENAPTSGK